MEKYWARYKPYSIDTTKQPADDEREFWTEFEADGLFEAIRISHEREFALRLEIKAEKDAPRLRALDEAKEAKAIAAADSACEQALAGGHMNTEGDLVHKGRGVVAPGTRRVAARVLTTYGRWLSQRYGNAESGYTSSKTIREAMSFFKSGWFGSFFFMISSGRGIVRFWGVESEELPTFANRSRR